MKRMMKFSWMLVLPMVAAVAIVWNASAAMPAGAKCPEVDPLDHYVFFPNLGDCSTFFYCRNGVPILMDCPEGLLFNAKLDVCDWPQYVDTKDCDDPEVIVTPPPMQYSCSNMVAMQEGLMTFFCGTCDWLPNSAPVLTVAPGMCIQ